MKLDVKTIREMHDKAYTHNQATREKAADDLLFYWITQWDSNYLEGSTLQFRGQFDVLRKAGRQIIADIKSNPVQVDFEPKDEDKEDSADVIDGLYRSDMRNNEALEAKENATTESIVCGNGGWELYTKFEGNGRDNKQRISRRPLFESNNNIFWDPNAKLYDKSDAEYVSCLVGYSEEGYKKLVKDLTNEEIDNISGSFSFPEHSYVFPWLGGDNTYYVTRFYHKSTKKVKIRVYADILGSEESLRDDEDEADFIDQGFELVDEYEFNESVISLYIVGGGDEILHHSIIPGEEIPVVPVYGERAFVEGEEHYEGITRLAKDPQRLRNFQMSYLADIVSKTPRQKPIYFPEQIQGFEWMYEENGADDSLPYNLMHRLSAAGDELPPGPVAVTPEQPIPQALANSFELVRQAIDDVAGTNLPKDIQETELSGEALLQLQKMFDKQSFIYQHNLKASLRREGEIYASMAKVVYADQRDVMLTKPDLTRYRETINEKSIDPKTLKLIVNNDIKNSDFDVYAEVGPSYNTVKDQDRKELKEMIAQEPPDSPMRQIMLLEYMTMHDGASFKGMRDYARKQLILQGIREPETDEEKQMLEQAQQQAQQQDPQTQALLMEGQARVMEGQAAIIDKEIDMFNAETKRAELDIKRQEANAKAAEAGVNMRLKLAQTAAVQVDSATKLRDSARINQV